MNRFEKGAVVPVLEFGSEGKKKEGGIDNSDRFTGLLCGGVA